MKRIDRVVKPKSLLLDLVWGKSFRHLDALVAKHPDLVGQLVLLVELNNVVAAADADAVDENVGHRPATSLFEQDILQGRTLDVLIEFDYEWRGGDVVFVEENALGCLGEGAVRLGEDDD